MVNGPLEVCICGLSRPYRVDATPDRSSVAVRVTVTVLRYQPMLPGVPLSNAVVVGRTPSTFNSPRLTGASILPAISTPKAYRSVSANGAVNGLRYAIQLPGSACVGAAAPCGTNW